MSIRLRLTLWYSGLLAVTMLVFGVVLYGALNVMLYSNQKSQMEEISSEIRQKITVTRWVINGQTQYAVNGLNRLDQFRYPGYFVQVSDQSGSIIKSTTDYPFPTEGAVAAAKKDKNMAERFKAQGKSFFMYNVPVKFEDRQNDVDIFVVLQVAAIVDSIDNQMRLLMYVLVVLFLITLFIAATFGLFLARKALKPIDNIVAATAQIENGADLDKRIDYIGPPDEIGKLTSTINSMLERIQLMYGELEESNRTQRRFVSDASHELRTPLTTIRGNVDLLEKMWRQQENENENARALDDKDKMELSLEAMQDIAGEASRMSRLVNDLLSLARADTGLQISKEALPMLPIVETVVRKAGMLPKSVDFIVGDLSALEGAVVSGSRDYLQQLLFIFIENAFKYTDEGYVRIDALKGSDQIGVRISDTGIGMDKEEVPHIFERFYRADKSRGQTSGTGLGLSIAKWIIDEHGGSIEVATRKDEGTTFVVWLPTSRFPEIME
ncbi:sensor histidine kinase [Paenibacillus contaminans]|uniref:histidine kinase n=1 Tax=Paenibacillus contaminans TaxID=450362 RepID=A0A329MT70_9BACL|nr:HAMP domain-containing sensor histidine kinase [Paenibacillus contaminans]RAV22556.1 two-component sensor histidine kinase [Paenibacillus contaminans]